MILADRIAIAKFWNQPKLSFEYVKHKLNWIMINNKISSTLTNTQAMDLLSW